MQSVLIFPVTINPLFGVVMLFVIFIACCFVFLFALILASKITKETLIEEDKQILKKSVNFPEIKEKDNVSNLIN